MGRLALHRRIDSAFVVTSGQYGDVRRFAQEQGVSRQWVYREAKQVTLTLEGTQTRREINRLKSEVAQLQQQVTHLQAQLAQAVVLDDDKQAEVACVGQACGVTLPQCRALLEVLIAKPLSVASLGRRTHAAGQRAGALLDVLDAYARPLVRDDAGDEISVSAPVLMVVERESLCWVCGRLSDDVSGASWAREFRQLPNLEQLARDGGKALAKGVALVNAERAAQGQETVVDQGDPFHALWTGGVGLRRVERRVRQALAAAEAADQGLAECARQGQKQTSPTARARRAWQRRQPKESGFTSLFNGKDFTGWRFSGGKDDGAAEAPNWKVKDGVISLSGSGSPHLATEKEYADFELRFEWRALRDKYNSGLFLRSGRDVRANQINLAKGGEGNFINGKVKGAKAVPDLQKPAGEWNEWRVLVKGDKITFWCNGKLAWEATEFKTKKGYIGLQAEGAPIEFRRLRIREIKE